MFVSQIQRWIASTHSARPNPFICLTEAGLQHFNFGMSCTVLWVSQFQIYDYPYFLAWTESFHIIRSISIASYGPRLISPTWHLPSMQIKRSTSNTVSIPSDRESCAVPILLLWLCDGVRNKQFLWEISQVNTSVSIGKLWLTGSDPGQFLTYLIRGTSTTLSGGKCIRRKIWRILTL